MPRPGEASRYYRAGVGAAAFQVIFFMMKLFNEYNFIPLLQTEAFSTYDKKSAQGGRFYINKIKYFGEITVKTLPFQEFYFH